MAHLSVWRHADFENTITHKYQENRQSSWAMVEKWTPTQNLMQLLCRHPGIQVIPYQNHQVHTASFILADLYPKWLCRYIWTMRGSLGTGGTDHCWLWSRLSWSSRASTIARRNKRSQNLPFTRHLSYLTQPSCTICFSVMKTHFQNTEAVWFL